MILAMLMVTGQDKDLKLEDLKWQNRVLLFFPGASEPSFDIKDSLSIEMEDRKLLLFVFGDPIISNQSKTFSSIETKQLQKRYRIDSQKSNWVLIGLDGGVKLRGEGELDMDLIFKTIDSMPMRASEKKRKI